jgi:hypothetical protein
MADELKSDMSPACREATWSPSPPPDPQNKTPAKPGAETAGETSELSEVSWFEAIGAEAAPPPPRRSYAASALIVLALIVAVFGRGAALRIALPGCLGFAAIAVTIYRARRAARVVRVERRRGLGIELGEGSHGGDANVPRLASAASFTPSSSAASSAALAPAQPSGRLLFKAIGAARAETWLSTSEPFGVTLFTTAHRDRAMIMLTSATGTFCVGASFDAASRRAFGPLFDRAFTVPGEETGLAAIGPDGDPILLPPAGFASLLEALLALDPMCMERLVLTDARGTPLLLDARELRLGERVFDLSAPLEWRGIVFQEAFGQAIAVYQGTWVRQGATEAVLVSLLPSLSSAGPASITDGAPLSALDRSVLRDLRLLQAVPEAPPPSDQRVAIERLFMLPVRFALDKAPRPAKQPTRIRA